MRDAGTDQTYKIESKLSLDSRLPEPIYLSLKLEKTIDVCGLMENLKYKISRENDITHPSDYNQDHLKKIYKWKDIAKILLRADKSWYKREELYHKYDVIKHKEAEPEKFVGKTNAYYKGFEDCEKKLIDEFVQIGKRVVNQMGKKYKNRNCCGMGYLETLFEREIKKLKARGG